MSRLENGHRLALAAPVALVYALTVVLALMVNAEPVAWLAVAASLLGPVALGAYVLSERPFALRLALSFVAPAGQWLLLVAVWLIVWRNAGTLPEWPLALATFGPVLALLVASAFFWRRVSAAGRRAWLVAAWVVAAAEGAAALPLAQWLARSSGVDTLASVVVVFAPAAALGVWIGLLCATALASQTPDDLGAGSAA